jgi:hypothetical protein
VDAPACRASEAVRAWIETVKIVLWIQEKPQMMRLFHLPSKKTKKAATQTRDGL